MECAEGCECKYVFAHCANCLKSNEPSGVMVMLMFDTTVEAYCRVCGLPVWSLTGDFHFANLQEAEEPGALKH